MGRAVAVVGGGISGLATAYFLRERARDSGVEIECTVIERDRRLGGKVLTENVDGLTMEGGPDSFLTLKPQALDLCKQLGLSDLLVGTSSAASNVFVYCGGRLRALPDGLASGVPAKLGPFLLGDLFTVWGRARMLLDLLLPRGRNGRDETLAMFIRRRLGHEALERLAEPLMAGIYAGDAEQLSMKANFPQLVRLETEHRSLILGTLLRSRRIDTDGGASGRYPTFMTIRGGLRVLVETLAQRLGKASIMAGEMVKAIRIDPSGARRAYSLELEDGTLLRADAVVLATPAYESARLLRGLNPVAASLLDSIPYVSTATVSLVYDSHGFSYPLNGSGFVVAPAARRKITACTWVSSKWPVHSPPDRLLLRCFVGRSGDEKMLEMGDDQLCKLVQEELKSIMGISDEPILKRVYRFHMSLPQYVMGHQEKLQALDDSMDSTDGVFLTGSAYRGVGLPDCIKQAALASERVLSFITQRNESPPLASLDLER